MSANSILEQHLSVAMHLGAAEWNTIIECIERRDYQQAIQILKAAAKTAVKQGNASEATLLKTALLVCQACIAQQSEIDAQRQRLLQARAHEKELHKQLTDLLSMTNNTPSITSEAQNGTAYEKLEGNGSLWQRVRTFFDKPDVPAEEPSVAEAEVVDETAVPEAVLPPVHAPDPAPPVPATNTLSVYCLGTFKVYVNGRLVNNWIGNKSKSVFKYMVINRKRPLPNDVLGNLFWPDDEPESAQRNLYQAVYMIRQALKCSHDFAHIIRQDSIYRFNPELEIWVDSEQFEAHYKNGLYLERNNQIADTVQAYEMADTLYEGDFLAEDIYEEWTHTHRERLKHGHLDILNRLSKHYRAEEQIAMCITICHKILQDDNCREDVHRRLMLAYLYQGQRNLALRQYHRCQEILDAELGVIPMPATVELYENILNSKI